MAQPDRSHPRHREISAALERLKEAAQAENKMNCVRFVERMQRHIQLEDEVLSPAAILTGEYVRLKLGK